MHLDPQILDELQLTQQEFNTAYITYTTLALLSLVLCVFVSVTYAVFKRNKFNGRLILCMSVCVCVKVCKSVYMTVCFIV